MKAVFRIFVFFVLLVGLNGRDCCAERKKKILVLHSYHQGLEWTDNITKGIQSVFIPFQRYYEIYYEYLDTKRNTGKDYVDQMIKFILTKNKQIKYEVIIVCDNNALKMLNDGSLHFYGNPPVVFCGINNYGNDLTNNIANVTGVVEATNPRATIELMQQLHPERNHIVVILDRTPTGEAVREELRDIELFYQGKLEFSFLRDFTLEEIPGKLSELDNNDMVYVLTFNRDSNNKYISYAEGIEMISNSTDVPLYGSWDFYLGKGIVGGRITSGYLQGQEAGKLALKILQGSQAQNLHIIANSPNQYMFDYKYLKKYGISLSALPSENQIINIPPSIFERHKNLFIVATCVSSFILLILLWKYKRQRSILKAKQSLALELGKKVQERTQELELAYKELQRLSNLDGLTQIYNRRYFENNLNKEINRHQRLSIPIALLFGDIDYFKLFNDTYGHLAGDDCIRLVADSIRQHCKRVSDIAARYGGEEFGIILPNTGAREAVTIAESIRHAIEASSIPHEASPIGKVVTISIGVASIVPEVHTTPATIISLADRALYESKHRGRNRVTLKAE